MVPTFRGDGSWWGTARAPGGWAGRAGGRRLLGPAQVGGAGVGRAWASAAGAAQLRPRASLHVHLPPLALMPGAAWAGKGRRGEGWSPEAGGGASAPAAPARPPAYWSDPGWGPGRCGPAGLRRGRPGPSDRRPSAQGLRLRDAGCGRRTMTAVRSALPKRRSLLRVGRLRPGPPSDARRAAGEVWAVSFPASLHVGHGIPSSALFPKFSSEREANSAWEPRAGLPLSPPETFAGPPPPPYPPPLIPTHTLAASPSPSVGARGSRALSE